MSHVRGLRRGERGATAVEYALILAGVAAVVIAGARLLGLGTLGLFERIHWP